MNIITIITIIAINKDYIIILIEELVSFNFKLFVIKFIIIVISYHFNPITLIMANFGFGVSVALFFVIK